ncbi:MAG: S41 family peptidase [Candidatus Caenarcaniphilales bacterium]|nr:S41 family peptidase [Candidatus Caenarcaniphilales bacterium]
MKSNKFFFLAMKICTNNFWKKFFFFFLTLICIFLILPLFAPARASLSSNQIFDKATYLLKENYYNQRFINSVLSYDNIDVCRQKLTQSQYTAINCLVKLIQDPYTKYLSASSAQKEFKRIQTIRISLGIITDPLNPRIISQVLASSPAEKAGIKKGDSLLAINGVPTDLMNEKEISQKTREVKNGEKVNLDLKRGYMFFSASLIGREIHSIAVRSKMLPKGFLYIKIDDLLSSSAPDEMLEILHSSNALNSRGLILDLRSNKGGLLNSGITIADFFLKRGNILLSESKDGEKQYKADPKIEYVKPVVVLINNETASAGEVIAAALQENHRAVLVGVTSYGKGLIQQIKTLPDGSALHITISKFYTPTGKAINGIGVQPNMFSIDLNEQIETAIAYLQTYLQTAKKN